MGLGDTSRYTEVSGHTPKNYLLIIVVAITLMLILFSVAVVILIIWPGTDTTTTTKATTKVTTEATTKITTKVTTRATTTTIATTTTKATTTTIPLVLKYSYFSEEDKGILSIYKGRVRINGEVENIGSKPAYQIDVECDFFDEYGVKIGDDSLCLGTCDLNLYPNDKETINFTWPTDNYKHVAKVDCIPKWKEKI